MASLSSMRIISKEESMEEYGLKDPGKEIVITGDEITDEKVQTVMKAFIQFIINGHKAEQKQILENFNKFKAICKKEKVDVVMR